MVYIPNYVTGGTDVPFFGGVPTMYDIPEEDEPLHPSMAAGPTSTSHSPLIDLPTRIPPAPSSAPAPSSDSARPTPSSQARTEPTISAQATKTGVDKPADKFEDDQLQWEACYNGIGAMEDH
jgi:hypothetical protein